MSVPPVVVEVEVPLDPPQAFMLFTDEIASWWPFVGHSVFGDPAASLHIPTQVGAEIVEVSSAGEACTWGTVHEYDAPHRIRFSWHPGRGADTAQEVEVAFTAIPGGTSVRLSHTGWEAAGTRATELRGSYATGWVVVLERFTAAARPRH